MTTFFTKPDVAGFLEFLNAAPGPAMNELSAVDARESMLVMAKMADLPIGEMAINRNFTIPGPAGDIPARHYDTRETRDVGPVMVFFHGGGFVIGDLDTHEGYCGEAARSLDIPVIAIDYRLAPEHPFPASSDDCEAAARWVADNIPCTGLVLAGESAGGNLTIITAMALRDRPASKPVIVQNPIYPVVSDHNDWQSMSDFADGYLLTRDLMDYFMMHYAAVPGDYRGSPLDFPQAGMPPSVVTTASLDPLHDQGVAYYEALVAAGVKAVHYEANGNIHGHIQLLQAIPSALEDVRAHLALVKTMIAEATA
jgi:acetyl esterase